MRKFLHYNKACISIVLSLLVCFNTHAQNFIIDGIYYNITDYTNKTVEVTHNESPFGIDFNNYSGSVTIPSTVTYSGTTYSVTSIGSSAFRNCTGLTSITIPNSVNKIDEYAFSYCDDLNEVNISDLSAWCKIDFVGISANPLSYGAKLKLNDIEITNLIIPNDISQIKDIAFYGCIGLTSITIPNSVTKIGGGAFYGCIGLTSITIPNSVTEIGGGAFRYCSGLTSVTIGNLATKIGGAAFEDTGWYNNQSDGILYLDNYCLGYKGNKPTDILSIKEGTRLISDCAFFDCSGMTEVSIPNSVTSIGDSAFESCDALTSVTIGNSVTSIGDGAFSHCFGLKSISIPNSVISIEDDAFRGCDGLSEVNISDLSAWCKISFGNFDANPLYNATKLILNGTEITNLVIPNDISRINYSAFINCSGLTSITIPNTVTSISSCAFYNCIGLTSVKSLNPIPPMCSSNSFYPVYDAILFIPEGTKDAYTTAMGWEYFTNIQEFAGIDNIEADSNAIEIARYDIHGRLLSEPTKGINIVKYSDGTTRKEIVK